MVLFEHTWYVTYQKEPITTCGIFDSDEIAHSRSLEWKKRDHAVIGIVANKIKDVTEEEYHKYLNYFHNRKE